MVKQYNWIPPVDHTINSKETYRSSVVDATLDDNQNIIMKTDLYFPVGSIFHYICSEIDYLIKSQDPDSAKYIYKVVRCDGQPPTLDDVFMLKKKKWIYRDGFQHKVK